MALVFEIILGLMILGSFFVAYVSARTWPIYQVVLVAFIFLGTVAFFYLSARTLATHNAWRKLVKDNQKQLAQVEKDTKLLVEGGPLDADGRPSNGIRQLKQNLANLAFDRGGVFYDVAVEGAQDGAVQIKLKSPDHGLAPNTVLFAFDQTPAEQGGQYLGEFKVAKVAAESPEVELVANLPLTAAQVQRMGAGEGPWTLYTKMPIDKLTAASQRSEQQDGERVLRDYELLFHEGYVQRSLLSDSISKLTSNLNRTNAALKSTNDEVGYRRSESGNLAADLARFQHERDALATYQQTLEKLLGTLRERLIATYVKNREMAAELTARQFKAANEINRRTAIGPPGNVQGTAVAQP